MDNPEQQVPTELAQSAAAEPTLVALPEPVVAEAAVSDNDPALAAGALDPAIEAKGDPSDNSAGMAEPPNPDLVQMSKAGETLAVHTSTVEAHQAAGWTIVR